MTELSIRDSVVSLFPKNWEQQHNLVRQILLEEQLGKLTGEDYFAYNLLIDYIEQNDYSRFCNLVEKLCEGVNSL